MTDEATPLMPSSLERLIPSLFVNDPELVDYQSPVPADALVQPTISLNSVKPVVPVTAKEFLEIIEDVREAIKNGIYPTRISKGSSGSYFCRGTDGRIVGIFKPRDEEPYGKLNPKWIKWIHRNCFPCCFGRSCIIPNTGYLSEAGASYIDRQLGLNVVPRTEIVLLTSPSFHYKLRDRWSYRLFDRKLPQKIGSFQLFLNDYVDATTFFNNGYLTLSQDPQSLEEGWPDHIRREFQKGFERLAILDYLIRNTDRGSDNWMVKYEPPSNELNGQVEENKVSGGVRIGAIDNGLAFPMKHPNQFRSYPYGWESLPLVYTPFSSETAAQFLPYLTSATWWDNTMQQLENLFSLDPDFKPQMFAKQKALIRGQGHNIVDTLAQSRIHPTSPFSMVHKPLIMIHEDLDLPEGDDVVLDNDSGLNTTARTRARLRKVKRRIETFTRTACFKNC